MIQKEKNVELFRTLPVPTAIINIDEPAFTIEGVNDAFKKISSRDESNLIGKSFSEAFQDKREGHNFSDFVKMLTTFRTVCETKETMKLPAVRYDISTDGNELQLKYWEITVAPYFDSEDKLAYLLCTASDETENVLIEEQKDIILNHTEGAFILTNDKLEILLCNEQFTQNYKEMFGIDVKTGVSILEYAFPERRKEVEQIYKQVLNGETIDLELPVPVNDDDFRYFDVIYKPARRANGDIFGAFITLRETTSEKKSQATFRRKGSSLSFTG